MFFLKCVVTIVDQDTTGHQDIYDLENQYSKKDDSSDHKTEIQSVPNSSSTSRLKKEYNCLKNKQLFIFCQNSLD